MDKKILILNGPNLNTLGMREPDVYGSETLTDIEARCASVGEELGLNVNCRQSNIEGELVGWIQEASSSADAVILNAGAYTHTSIAILDALRGSKLPVIEVHLSNIFQREDYRHHSYVSEVASGVICGFGSQGYELALAAAARLLNTE
jgi:3-dehydroquinate dehydratase-2